MQASGLCTRQAKGSPQERKGDTAEVLMANPCTN